MHYERADLHFKGKSQAKVRFDRIKIISFHFIKKNCKISFGRFQKSSETIQLDLL